MTPRRVNGAFALMLAALVGGCATSTPYQPYRPEFMGGVHGGFSDEQLSADHFRVRFHGNEFTSRERVEGYLLYRAAELTLRNGFDWFRIADRHLDHEVRTIERLPIAPGVPWYGRGFEDWRPHWRYYDRATGWRIWHPEQGGRFWADQMDVSTVESFEAEADVMMGRGAPLPSEPGTYDARRVIANLGPSIVLPPARN